MKKYYTLLYLLLLCTISAFAQAPEKLSYQAIIRNNSDNILANQAVGIQISILRGTTTGNEVYVERQRPTSNANGLINLEIGSGNLVSGSFTAIDWGNDSYFVRTEIDLTGGSNYTITGISQLMSVPYALHAKTAETFTGTITETDPIFRASAARNITASDIFSWNDKEDKLPSNGTVGQLLQTNGSGTYAWVNPSAGSDTQDLSLSGNTISLTDGGTVDIGNATAVLANTTKVGITTAQANEIVANTLKVGITTAQANEIAANTLKAGITTAQANEIAANTLKAGITSAQANEIVANTLKVGYTDALVSANSDVAANTLKTGITTAQASEIAANTLKVGYTDALVSANTDVVANTAKVGITTAQASEIAANTLKVGYTDALVSANTDVVANTLKTGITTAQANEIAANTLKAGITTAQANEIAANTLKVGITTTQANEIAANTLKVGYTEALVSANTDVAANTAKVGITTAQANEIAANTLKVGYTDALVSANTDVVANTAKVGITTAQANEIAANTLKAGITTAQANEIAANTLKVGYTEALVSANTDVAANTAKVGITTAQANEIAANTLKVGYTDALVSANTDVVANTAKAGITTAQANEIAANTLKVGYTEALVSANTDVAANTAKLSFPTADKDKLDAIEAGAQVNVQADWNETDTANDAYIANKPTLGTAAALNVGIAANNLVQLDANAILPALDGSQLTNLPSSSVSITTQSANYTATATDNFIICTAAITISLPTAVGNTGKEYTIKNMFAGNVTVAANGSEQIWQDAATITATATIGREAHNNWIKVISDGSNWISFRALY